MITRLCALVLALSMLPGLALAQFEAHWQQPQDGEQALFAGALRDSNIVADALKLAHQPLRWPQPLRLRLGGEGEPHFDPGDNTVSLPYHYLAKAVRAQAEFEPSRAAALQRGLDVVEYTLYQLLGHALLGGHDVDRDPEAEALATWLMVTATDNGGEQWLEDVEAFARASQRLDGPLSDYWHGHGLSKRAEQRLNCLVVGSAPNRYLERFPGLREAPAQAAACETEWRALEAKVRQAYTREVP